MRKLFAVAMCAVHMPYFPGFTRRESEELIKWFVQKLVKLTVPAGPEAA